MGKPFILLGSAIIFAAAAVDGQLPQPWFGTIASGSGAAVMSALLAATSLVAMGRWPGAKASNLIVAVAWVAAAAFALSNILWVGPSVGLVVALMEGAVLAAACLVLAQTRSPLLLRHSLAIMLVVFGTVHLLWRQAIAGLIPDLVPFAAAWPLLTGPVQIAAGVAGISRSWAGTAFLAIAAMYLAWIPLIHVPRLIADFSTGEVAFGAMALALAGCLVLAAARSPQGSETTVYSR